MRHFSTRTAQISVVTFMYVTVVNRGYSVRPTGSSEPSLHVPLPFLALNPTNTLSYGINIFSFLVYTWEHTAIAFLGLTYSS